MPLPTQPVTCRFFDQSGNPAAGARVVFRLSVTEVYDGFVAPELVEATADVNGECVVSLFPNALGSNASQYEVKAWNADDGRKILDAYCSVPDSACLLHEIVILEPYPAVDQALQAMLAAQSALSLVTAQRLLAETAAGAASDSASDASTSAAEAAASAAAAETSGSAIALRADLASTVSGKGAEMVGFKQAGVGAVDRDVAKELNEHVSISQFGGSPSASAATNSAALIAALGAHNHVYFPDGVYEFSFDVASGNRSLVTITDRDGIRITGRGATLKDVSAYNGDYLTDVIKFVRCTNIYVDVNYDATPLVDPTAAYPNGIGHTGSAFLYFEEGCSNIKVDSSVSNCRYGVRSGNYSTPEYGYCSGFDIKLNCYKAGYPVALYLADNVYLRINSEYQHRALYLAGCENVRGSVTYKGYTYANQAVLFTSSVTVVSAVDADRRARGCSDVEFSITDNGSIGTFSARAAIGLALQWLAPDTTFDGLRLNLFARTTDSNRTLAALRLESVVGWYATNRLSNIKLSGVLDRSAQTLGASSWADISIAGHTSGEVAPYPTAPQFDNLSFDGFTVINSSVTGNNNNILVPNLVGKVLFKNVNMYYGNFSIIARTGSVNIYDSLLGNFTTGDIVASMFALNSTIGTVSAGISYRDGSTTVGTFTPALTGTGVAGAGTYTVQVGHYTKIGNLVTVFGQIGWSAHTGAGNMKIAGLPFTSASSKGFCPVTVVPSAITSPANSVVAAMVPPNEAAINLYSITESTAAFAALAIDTSGSLWFSGTYETS